MLAPGMPSVSALILAISALTDWEGSVRWSNGGQAYERGNRRWIAATLLSWLKPNDRSQRRDAFLGADDLLRPGSRGRRSVRC